MKTELGRSKRTKACVLVGETALNRHLPQLIEHLIGLGTSPEVAVDLMSKIADSWQLSLGQMREGARLYSSRTAKRDEDTVTPETTMTLGQFKQVMEQTFELALAANSS